MQVTQQFEQAPQENFWHWISFCVVGGASVWLSSLVGLLQQASILAIVAFVVVRGIMPYRRFAAVYNQDAITCREEKEVLGDMDFDQAVILQDIHDPEAGTLFRQIQFVDGNKRRMSKRESIDAFLGVAEREWEDLLEPLIDSVEQAPNLGLFGTIVGMQLAMAELAAQGADPQGMVAAIGIALQTTLAGCTGGFVLLGLRSRAQSIVRKHLAEIELIASQMLGDE